MSKHTPGPWSYHSWGKGSGKSFGIETADHRHGIAGVTPNGNASTLVSMKQHEANARLIAAAPELLEACQAIIDNWESGDLADAARQCFSAVAAATGK